jgi:predicted AlkP superfamily pyrophosphatase or phosphodiesterase
LAVRLIGVSVIASLTVLLNFAAPSQAQTPAKQPNIIVIMGDDVGWFNIGAYHQGIMSGKTPNLDKLASEGSALPITTPKRVAPRAERTSLPANCPSVPA